MALLVILQFHLQHQIQMRTTLWGTKKLQGRIQIRNEFCLFPKCQQDFISTEKRKKERKKTLFQQMFVF